MWRNGGMGQWKDLRAGGSGFNSCTSSINSRFVFSFSCSPFLLSFFTLMRKTRVGNNGPLVHIHSTGRDGL